MSSQTDARGKFDLNNLSPGRYTFVARGDSQTIGVLHGIVLEEGLDTNGVSLMLSPASPLPTSE